MRALQTNFNVSVPKGARRALGAHEGACNSLRFNDSGSLLITAGSDGTAKLWDPRTGMQKGTLRCATRAPAARPRASGDSHGRGAAARGGPW